MKTILRSWVGRGKVLVDQDNGKSSQQEEGCCGGATGLVRGVGGFVLVGGRSDFDGFVAVV